MKLCTVAFVLVSTSGVHAAGAMIASRSPKRPAIGGESTTQERTTTKLAGGWRGVKRPAIGGDGTTQERAATKFAGWWRGLKRHPTSGDRGIPHMGATGRPTLYTASGHP